MVLTGREKATIFLSILGAETAARLLRYLPEELANVIAAGIDRLPAPAPEALAEVLDEFASYLALPEAGAPRRLEEAPTPPPPSPPPRKTYSILMDERPQLIAYLLRMMSEEEKSEALLNLYKERHIIEDLLRNLRKNRLFPKLESRLKEVFAGKIFAE